MRIALVVPGGVDRSGTRRVIPALLWLIERLARRHSIHVFALSQYLEPCRYDLLGAKVVNLGVRPDSGPPGSLLFRHGRALSKELRDAGPFDVVHAFWANPPGFLAAAAAPRGSPLVVSLGGGELTALPEIAYGSDLYLKERLKVAFALRRAARVTVASRTMERLALEHGHLTEIIPLGVDGGCFRTAPRGSADGARLLHVATLNRVKDPFTLVRAFRLVLAGRPGARLDVVGEDTLDGAVHAECAALGLSGRVTFHGFLPSEEVRPLFARADLFVLTSLHDAGPVAVLEAAACGVPTVGSAVGHVADLAPSAALAVRAGNAEALARGILELLADAPRREAMGSAAREWARVHDAGFTAREFERLYEEVGASR